MQKNTSVIKNQEGSVVVVALLILLLLTMVGFSSINTSSVESHIVRNTTIYKRNFYRAEAANFEGGRGLEDASDDQLMDRSPTWLNDNTVNMTVPANWDGFNSVVSTIEPNTRYSVIDEGIARLESLEPRAKGVSKLQRYAVYGLYNLINGRDSGQILIQTGYRKRF